MLKITRESGDSDAPQLEAAQRRASRFVWALIARPGCSSLQIQHFRNLRRP